MKTKVATRFWYLLLVLLGFGAVACKPSIDPIDEPQSTTPPPVDDPYSGVDMYGTPQCVFEYKAKVIDREGMPVSGIQMLSVEARHGQFYKPPFDNKQYLFSDVNGGVAGTSYVGRWDSVFFFLHDPAGRFADTLCAYKIQPSEFSDKGKGEWTVGSVTKSVEIKVHTK